MKRSRAHCGSLGELSVGWSCWVCRYGREDAVAEATDRRIQLANRDLANLLDTLAPSKGIGEVAFGDRRWRNPDWLVRPLRPQREPAVV